MKHFPQRSIALHERTKLIQSLAAVRIETRVAVSFDVHYPYVISIKRKSYLNQPPRLRKTLKRCLSSDCRSARRRQAIKITRGEREEIRRRHVALLRPTHLFTFRQSSPRGLHGPPDFSTNEKGPSLAGSPALSLSLPLYLPLSPLRPARRARPPATC